MSSYTAQTDQDDADMGSIQTKQGERLRGQSVDSKTACGASLPRRMVSLAQLESIWRRHWTIENQLHHVRDVSFGEDHCQVHTGSAPQALAAFRNGILALLRYEG